MVLEIGKSVLTNKWYMWNRPKNRPYPKRKTEINDDTLRFIALDWLEELIEENKEATLKFSNKVNKMNFKVTIQRVDD